MEPIAALPQKSRLDFVTVRSPGCAFEHKGRKNYTRAALDALGGVYLSLEKYKALWAAHRRGWASYFVVTTAEGVGYIPLLLIDPRRVEKSKRRDVRQPQDREPCIMVECRRFYWLAQ